MSLGRPFRPLTSALRAVAGQTTNVAAWAPWLVLALAKAILFVGLGRFDLVPSFLWVPVLEVAPGLESRIHYPATALALPDLVRRVDFVLFLTAGILAQAWTIARLGRAWGATPPLWCGVRRLLRLVTLAAILVVLPALVSLGLALLASGVNAGVWAGACAAVAAALLFAAPAFVVVHDLGLWTSMRASVMLLRRLPFAVPLAIAVIAIPHVPGLVLRTPALQAGAANDPDWIVLALLGQLPAHVLGSCLAAGLATYFALRTRSHREGPRARGLRPAVAATAALVALLTTGCGEGARSLSLRFACERWVERARLRADALRESEAPVDSLAWLHVATLYGRTIERLETARPNLLMHGAAAGIERDLGRLGCEARVGRAEAWARAGRVAPARADYGLVIAQTAYRGVRADAALGLALCEDRARNWNAAFTAYRDWLGGVATGVWPLRPNGLEVPAYVAHRLGDRGAGEARERWVDSAAQALATAAGRNELAREARLTRFALLLAAARWDAAYAALHELRELHDPQGLDGALVVAEASLLAGGMRRDDAALGVLRPLHDEQSPFDGQHRVAGWLLTGNILQRRGDNVAASTAFEHAVSDARSEAGRSEATLGLARVCAARGDVDAARRYYTQLRDVWPATAAGLVAPLEEIRMLREHGRDADADALVAIAQRGYEEVIRRFGTERQALVAARCLGETYGLEGRWDRSVTFLENASTSFGQDASAGTLLLHAARLAADKLHDERRAAELLDRLATRFPNSDQAVMARDLADSLAVRSRESAPSSLP